MDLIREYWWLILLATIAIAVAFLLLRQRQSVRLTESTPIRPRMAGSRPPEGRGLAGEAAAAASDVTGELLGAPVRGKLEGDGKPGDDLCRIKGVGPKLADALKALGFHRYDQLAQLSPTEV